MRTFLESILGNYTPRTVVVDGVTVALQGVASLDWSYIFTALIFTICVFCIFKILGGILCKIF